MCHGAGRRTAPAVEAEEMEENGLGEPDHVLGCRTGPVLGILWGFRLKHADKRNVEDVEDLAGGAGVESRSRKEKMRHTARLRGRPTTCAMQCWTWSGCFGEKATMRQ